MGPLLFVAGAVGGLISLAFLVSLLLIEPVAFFVVMAIGALAWHLAGKPWTRAGRDQARRGATATHTSPSSTTTMRISDGDWVPAIVGRESAPARTSDGHERRRAPTLGSPDDALALEHRLISQYDALGDCLRALRAGGPAPVGLDLKGGYSFGVQSGACNYGKSSCTLGELGLSVPSAREPILDGWNGLQGRGRSSVKRRHL